MDFAQLQTRLGQLGVRPKDEYRAALYIDHLAAAQTYFQTTLAGPVGAVPPGLGDGYSFVAAALRSASLLQELADILDFYVAPAVKGDLNRAYTQLGHGGPTGWTYADYFTNQILNANFDANIQTFRNMYPIATHALERLAANFQVNIFLACQRIIDDRAGLTNFYDDLYHNSLFIRSLRAIKSTGSDFHKGGKQVLILTFDIIYLFPHGPPLGLAPSQGELKVVYKPSDLEIDCLIAGDSTVVNRVIGHNFMTESLFEIYNERLQVIKTGNANFTGEPLPTYRILPRNYLSTYNGGYPLPIRGAYGYVEYLDYDLSGTAQQVFGYYPFGASDYLIFQSQDKDAIVRSFYRREGALTALCGSFSIVDMHVENVRVMQYAPYLIDLEVSLTQQIDTIYKTELLTDDMLADASGISGVAIDGQKREWKVLNSDTRGNASTVLRGQIDYGQNRLWSAYDDPKLQVFRKKKVVDVSQQYLLEGFNDGMAVLQAVLQAGGPVNNRVALWFARLTNPNPVLVRVLPFGTKDFSDIRDAIFITNGEVPNAALNTTQQAELRTVLTQEFNKFAQAHDPAADPRFVSLTQAVAGPDYLNLDIPVFYHRIGTTEIVDSNGAQVPIGPTVTINAPGVNPNPPTVPADVTPPSPPGVLNRTTYYAAAPTQPIVNQGQVQILVGAGFGARVAGLTGNITQCLGTRDNILNQPSKIVGVDT